jgi:hypothetical protein
MQHRVRLAGAVEVRSGEALEAMIAQFQAGMLAGDEQPWRLPDLGECMRDWTEFDRFGTRSYNERYSRLTHFPPGFGKTLLAQAAVAGNPGRNPS